MGLDVDAYLDVGHKTQYMPQLGPQMSETIPDIPVLDIRDLNVHWQCNCL